MIIVEDKSNPISLYFPYNLDKSATNSYTLVLRSEDGRKSYTFNISDTCDSILYIHTTINLNSVDNGEYAWTIYFSGIQKSSGLIRIGEIKTTKEIYEQNQNARKEWNS